MNETRFTDSDRWFVGMFLLLTALNVLTIWTSPLDLSPDEAHYAEWSKRIDWAFYSKGPAIAVLIRAGTMLFGDSTFGVRLPACLCFAFFSALFYLFLRQLAGSRPALAAWLAMRAVPLFAQTGVVITTDAPAAVFWLVAVICAHRALVEEEPPYWVGFGAAVGLGMLAEYEVGILYPSVFLLMFLTPHLRRHLIHPAFIAGGIVCFFAVFPLLKWNADHGWINVTHNARYLLGEKLVRFEPIHFGRLVVEQVVYVGPIVLAGILLALWVGVKEWKQDDRVSGLLLFTAAPLGMLICVLSFFNPVYANWTIPVYISGLLLLAYLVANYRIVSTRVSSLIRPGILLSACITGLAHLAFFGVDLGIHPSLLPTGKLFGWSELTRSVDENVEKVRRETGHAPFVLTTDYQIASEISFYSKSASPVLCTHPGAGRMNQYDIWGGLDAMRGRSAIVISQDPADEVALQPRFAELHALSGELPIVAHEKTLRTFRLYKGVAWNGASTPAANAR